MKYILAILVFGLGIGVGVYISGEEDKILSEQTQEQLRKNISSAHSLTEINKTSALSKKFSLEEAKVLYGKAFLLFLANIGLELNSEQKSALESILDIPPDEIDEKLVKDKLKNADLIVASNYEDKRDSSKLKASFNETEELARKALKEKSSEIALKDPIIYKARSKYIKEWNPTIQSLVGRYFGKLTWIKTEKNGRVDDFEMSINFRKGEKNEVEGEFELILSHLGDNYSHSRGSGGNGDVRAHPNDPEGIIIEVGPNWFLHGNLKNLSVMNFYQESDLVGVVQIFNQ